MDDAIRIIAVGDVVGQFSTEKLCRNIRALKKKYLADAMIVNAENAANGNGLDVYSADRLLHFGADVLTGGNHTFRRSEIRDYLDGSTYVIRPANYPEPCPGRGYTVLSACGVRILVMNILGRVYMDPVDDPFRAVERMLSEAAGTYDVSILDVHAEATSEKLALANCFDGVVTAVFGTHTHVQTSDARLLPKGTAYLTDLGMTGRTNSILGVDCKPIIERFRTGRPTKFNVGDGETECCFAVITVNRNSLRAEKIEAFREIITV
ncbi:MAG: TIGR00282 family metallophosphoesterase [Clostridia bacterium]|nr:TIGR00282 family metallophosphoesterase [Clostridia bacterium]MBR5768417.1 TIGR00282 family metallophosphoesterase [Clostridia bacterium]